MAYYDFFGKLMPTTRWTSTTQTLSTVTALVSSTLNGTSGADSFYFSAAGTAIGGAGDDMYQGVTNKTKIVEGANGGIDTVYVSGDYVMADNIENLTVWYARSGVYGNALANLMIGSSGSEKINGGMGNDVLVGSGGNDTFEFSKNSGYDLITDFATTGADADKVRLAGYTAFTTFSQVKAAMTQSGADVILTLDGSNAVKFSNHKIADFTADNFQLAIDTSKLKLTFDEEFDALSLWNGQKGAASSGTWRTDYGYGSTRDALNSRTLAGNAEKEIYIDPTMKGAGTKAIGLSPFSINDGVMTITAAPTPDALKSQLYNMPFTSGLLTTKQSFSQQYGYFEARMDVPVGSGLWPAFWLLPADGSWPPEIDIMEGWGGNDTNYTVHSSATGTHKQAYVTNYDPTTSEGFHTYGLLWTAETITWYFDGVAVFQQKTPPDLNKPMYMLLDLAVQSTAASDLTGQLKVDYVRAYSLDAATSASTGATQAAVASLALSSVVPEVQVRHMVGTVANDTFKVNNVGDTITEDADSGMDTVIASVDYTLPTNVEFLTLTGSAVKGTGNDLNNLLTGNALDNVLIGGGGNDTIDGKAGADTMYGGTGNDIFYVDNVGDKVIEYANEGTDTVISSVDYTLTANVENLMLTGSAIRGMGNDINNVLTGNDLDNVLTGGAGNDTLDGKAGADTMYGGTGNDIYVVDNVGDKVIEYANEGTDTVMSSVDYVLGANVENLILSGAAVRGTGNDLNNVLTGNALDNVLIGGGGNDTIDGKDGADTMYGGTGNDIYFVDNVGDRVIEYANEGTDTVMSSIDYVLGANVENLTLRGDAIRATGNALANTIVGNSGNNIINGGAGNDILVGGGGEDTFVFGPGFGKDTITDFNVDEDHLDVSALLVAHITPTLKAVGANTVISFGADTITLIGVRPADVVSHHLLG